MARGGVIDDVKMGEELGMSGLEFCWLRVAYPRIIEIIEELKSGRTPSVLKEFEAEKECAPGPRRSFLDTLYDWSAPVDSAA